MLLYATIFHLLDTGSVLKMTQTSCGCEVVLISGLLLCSALMVEVGIVFPQRFEFLRSTKLPPGERCFQGVFQFGCIHKGPKNDDAMHGYKKSHYICTLLHSYKKCHYICTLLYAPKRNLSAMIRSALCYASLSSHKSVSKQKQPARNGETNNHTPALFTIHSHSKFSSYKSSM
jgi:hypothetical protein